jgi:OmcA/MtrC family decaheme c-type cytochrome
VIYGFGGSVNDFSRVVFPRGKLQDCAACHVGTSYQLTGIWVSSTANGILANTTSTGASTTDPADNLRTTPIASVCSSCHDSAAVKTHMQDPFNGGIFAATQAAINAAPPENCSFCHGPGKSTDVQKVHGVK